MNLWQTLADLANVLLIRKLKEPLNGSDMVQIVTLWREMVKKEKQHP
jgi:hypothetical protein